MGLIGIAEDDAVEVGLRGREAAYPLAVTAFRSLLRLQASYAGVVSAALRRADGFWDASEERCGEILHLCDGSREGFGQAVLEWLRFSYEHLRRQQKFLRTGRYASTDFGALQQELYDNPARMKQFYLMALLFSFVFSSNYIAFFQFFGREMLPRLKGCRAVCDVGCGHGVYLAQMLRAESAAFGTGMDISPASLEVSARLLGHHGIPPASYRLALGNLQDALPLDAATQDAATCFEVIEHLENPGHALRELRRVLRPGGTLCLSTAIRMESIDHLHLFRSPEEVRALTGEAGFRTDREECIPLTAEDPSDRAEWARLIDDPSVALGYVALLS
jgi:2-polyprenyl-3-methyl-5-hydroxy-6-metoxy-1,4-benzoquinol methylase